KYSARYYGKFSDEKLDKKLGKKPEVLRQIFPFKYFFVFERSLILAISQELEKLRKKFISNNKVVSQP
ncbi:MAG: hypothetical protein MK289_03940, partial [Trichodesmium sp. ALOHA_ZT_67]|nr:hypothetical protein [Trichodesmium sp. ALOHA_ZT_67]